MRLLVDAVCLHILSSEKLLVAIGNRLLLLWLGANGETCRKFVPLPRLPDKIHGIAIRPSGDGFRVILHAGRELYGFEIDEFNAFVGVERLMRLGDWVSSVALYNENECCIVTGHGIALRIVKNADGAWTVKEQCHCDDRSTLYCSTVSGDDWDRSICCSGTALGLLLVWTFDGQSGGQIVQSIHAHNGVVFSIACDFTSGLLVTTSDDRSVKFWSTTLGADGIRIAPKQYCFGHTARVFSCKIITEGCAQFVASIGEDSNVCLWNTEGDLLVKKRLDDGPTLWSLDYDRATRTVFTTASNGNLHKFCIERWIIGTESEEQVVDVTPPLERERVSKVKFLPDGWLVGITDKNRLIRMSSDKATAPITIDQLDQFKCNLFEVVENRLFVFGGLFVNVYTMTASGTLELCKSMEINFDLEPFASANEKFTVVLIRSFNYCKNSNTIAICDNNGRCLIYDQTAEMLLSCHRIPKTPERWLTSYYGIGDRLLLADRAGHLHLFLRDSVDPVFKLPNVHGTLGITSIMLQNDSQEYTRDGYFFTTSGHNGCLCEVFLDRTRNVLEVLASTKCPIQWVDRTLPIPEKGALYLGFNDSRFTIANDQNDMLCSFDCGGGHRYWDFHHTSDPPSFSVVFIHQKRLKRMSFVEQPDTGSRLSLPRHNWHSKACNTLLTVPSGAAGGTLLLSGGEDNIVRINTFAEHELRDVPRRHLFSHISSVKTICVKQLPEQNELLVISAGGRAQICLTTLDKLSLRTKLECNHMLLATDSVRTRWKTNRTTAFDPETRFMCVTLLANGWLVFGCSDGFLRLYELAQPTSGNWTVKPQQEIFYGKCILNVTGLTYNGRTIFVTMATDGYLTLWDCSQLDEPFYRHRHHDSGVNAFDVWSHTEQRFTIATGGDDQSVVVSLFELTSNAGDTATITCNVIHTIRESGLHTAQVTGVKFLNERELLSAGVDQMVYRVNLDGRQKLHVTGQFRTCVADVKGLAVMPDQHELLVYGCGIECIDLNGF